MGECRATHSGTSKLAGIWVLWLAGYLATMAAVTWAGFQPIPGHFTPFYAKLDPAGLSPWEIPGALGMAWFVYLLLRTLLQKRQWRRADTAGTILALAALAGVHVAAYRSGVETLAYRPVAAVLIAGRLLAPHIPPLAVASLLLATLAWTTRRRDWNEEACERRAPLLLAGLVLCAFLYAGSVAMMRGGVEAISHPYLRTSAEYIGDIGKGGAIRGLFADFAALHGELSDHAQVHPPGPIALLWIFSYIVGDSPLNLALCTMAFASLACVPLYLWARELGSARAAAAAATLYIAVPSVVIFTATSADMLFPPFTLATLFLFERAMRRRSTGCALAAGVGYGLMSMLSYNLLAVGVYFGFVGLWRLRDPAMRRTVVTTAAAMLTAFLCVQAAVYLWSGFDLVTCLRLSLRAHAGFEGSKAVQGGYPLSTWGWRLLNPVTWFYFAGIPVSLLFLRRLGHAGAEPRAPYVAMALTVLALDLLYTARGESERTAVYIFPFLVIPAADMLGRLGERCRFADVLLAAVGVMLMQAWLTEALFYTYW